MRQAGRLGGARIVAGCGARSARRVSPRLRLRPAPDTSASCAWLCSAPFRAHDSPSSALVPGVVLAWQCSWRTGRSGVGTTRLFSDRACSARRSARAWVTRFGSEPIAQPAAIQRKLMTDPEQYGHNGHASIHSAPVRTGVAGAAVDLAFVRRGTVAARLPRHAPAAARARERTVRALRRWRTALALLAWPRRSSRWAAGTRQRATLAGGSLHGQTTVAWVRRARIQKAAGLPINHPTPRARNRAQRFRHRRQGAQRSPDRSGSDPRHDAGNAASEVRHRQQAIGSVRSPRVARAGLSSA